MQSRTAAHGLAALAVAAASEVSDVRGQTDGPTPRSEDVASIEAVMEAAYQAVSAEPGRGRDLDRFRSLFRPDAKLLSVSRREGATFATPLTLDDFARSFAGVVADGVFERQIWKRIDRFGEIAQVWSVYEIRATPESPVRARGVNSLELLFESGRWWIAGGQFQNESPGFELPAVYGGAQP